MNRVCLIAFLLASSLSTMATGPASTEATVVHRLTLIIQFESNLNGGQLATNWHQIEHALGSQNRTLMQHGFDPVQSLYVFAPTNLQLLQPHTGHVILARCEPVRESGQIGRFVIYSDPRSDPELAIQSNFILEGEFQKMLKEAGATLPDPNPEEVRAAREAVRRALAQEEAEKRLIEAHAPRLTWAEHWSLFKARIRAVFFKQIQTGSETSPAYRYQIKPVPVVIVGVFLVAIGFLVVRLLFKCKVPAD